MGKDFKIPLTTGKNPAIITICADEYPWVSLCFDAGSSRWRIPGARSMEGAPMLEELTRSRKAVGVKQCRRAVREGRAVRVYLACDADPAVTEPAAAECQTYGVEVVTDYTKGQLGRACGIAVGASAVAVVG